MIHFPPQVIEQFGSLQMVFAAIRWVSTHRTLQLFKGDVWVSAFGMRPQMCSVMVCGVVGTSHTRLARCKNTWKRPRSCVRKLMALEVLCAIEPGRACVAVLVLNRLTVLVRHTALVGLPITGALRKSDSSTSHGVKSEGKRLSFQADIEVRCAILTKLSARSNRLSHLLGVAPLNRTLLMATVC